MTNSLVIFTKAALMLAEADTIQKAKELKSLALTAAEWAKRKSMGEEAIQYCRSYALEAERKMGQMLLAGKEAGTVRTRGRHPKTSQTAVLEIKDVGLTHKESSQAQKLAAIPEERFEELKAGLKTKKEALNPTHVGYNSGENEWYTPPEFIKAARLAMGGIDCDPASTHIANKTVKAKKYFNKEQDGLKQKWAGKVWLNPPYANPFIKQFANAVAEKFERGEIEQACVLVNNATETEWFARIAGVASAICFPSARVRFLDPNGNPGAPLQGQAVLYLGPRRREFCSALAGFGFCVHVIRSTA